MKSGRGGGEYIRDDVKRIMFRKMGENVLCKGPGREGGKRTGCKIQLRAYLGALRGRRGEKEK